ncbi:MULTISPECIES: hypothetical protein [Vibrio]|uniref:hypothetical protein n=1 Tax=Vibrio TaxID=662 RepID=UPI0007406DCD|nr:MULTISPECIES: hypothetical protein [Vibrio]KUI97459.1 hypothetical protein VRK_34300 [Vibrio sp. MEBiC08052]WNJ97272.1 hypothetical protein RND59_18880 [Vibrio ruber]
MFSKHYVFVPAELEIETFRSPEKAETTATEREELVRQAQELGMQESAMTDYKKCA